MNAFFTEVLNMSITASVMILAVILFRVVFKRIPKWLYGIMWAMVAIRLIVPFSFESALSFAPNVQKISNTNHSQTAYVQPNIAKTESVNVFGILAVVWLIGVVAMLTYMFASYYRLRKKVRESIKDNDVWYCDNISSPFVLGFIKPKIYLNSAMSSTENTYIIAHEQAHIKRLDYIWKPLGFVVLSLHWFNPLCWVAYQLFNKDIELACDEKVIKNLDTKGKKAYSTALLACSAPRKVATACPIAFGEASVKQRIISVLSYKKPTLYIIILAIVACVVIAVLFMTSPVSAKTQPVTIPDVPVTIPATEPTVAPTTVPATEVPTTEPATEPVTEPPTEDVTQEVTEEYYDDSYYEEYYEDDYYEEEYYDDSSSEENPKDIVIPHSIDLNPERFAHIYDYVDSDSSFADWSVPKKPYTDPLNSEDFIFAWDPVVEKNQFR